MTKSGFTFRTGNQFESVCMIEMTGRADSKLGIAMINCEKHAAL